MNLRSSLLALETETLYDGDGNPFQEQRQSSAIFNDIFWGNGYLYLGDPSNFTQQVSLASRPVVPPLLDLDRFLDFNLSYQVGYSWNANLQQANLGRSASYNATVNAQMNFKLKSLTDPWFSAPVSGPTSATRNERLPAPGRRQPKQAETGAEGEKPQPPTITYTEEELQAKSLGELLEMFRTSYGDQFGEEMAMITDAVEKEKEMSRMADSGEDKDNLEMVVQLNDDITKARKIATEILSGQRTPGAPLDAPAGPNVGKVLSDMAYYLIKVPFLDYDNLGLTFAQTNPSPVGGVRGQPGFTPFGTSSPFGGPPAADIGPSRLYQLGLISDPNPSSGTLGFTSSFPYVGIKNYARGLRVSNPNGVYIDNYSQANNFNVKTNRPLWEGARLDLNWDLRWSINKNYQIQTNAAGEQLITSVTSTGSIERSYFMFPDMLLFGIFNTNMKSVNNKYRDLLQDPGDQRAASEKLTQAFEEGFEAIPWLSTLLGEFFPRVNWSLRWDGLEKWSLLESIADRISLEHRYTSVLTTGYRNDQDYGVRITELKRAGYNFAPLLGMTFNWTQLWGGDLSLQARWGKQGNFDLNSSSSNIVETVTDEITLTANFRKSGFEMPMFGISLKNDIDFSFSFSAAKNSSLLFAVKDLGGIADPVGQPREGTLRLTIEPRVKYTISQRVQAALFYRYQRTKPDAEVGSRIPGTTIHEGGLEVRITIAGS